MQTFEAIIARPELGLLVAASALAGIGVGLAAWVLAHAVQVNAGTAGAAVLEVRRRSRPAGHRRVSGAPQRMALVFLPVVRALGMKGLTASLAERYARAGWPGGLDDDELVSLSLLLGLALSMPLMAAIWLIVPLAAPLGLVLVVAGPGVVSAHLNRAGEKRELAITRTMPFVLDLLVLTMRAGASLQQAIDRVALDYARHPIGQEFRTVLGDFEMGVTVKESFETMAARVPIPAVTAFVDELVQAEELGRPLAEVLERQADHSRIRRVQEAVDTAGRAKVLVLVPGMLVFAATLILLFSPFVVRYFYGGYTVG